MHRRVLQLLVTLCVFAADAAAAQTTGLAQDGPRFVMAGMAGQPPVDASDAPMLQRRVSAAMEGVPLGDALREVGRQAGVRFAVSREWVPVDKKVSLRATEITLGAALFELLSGLDLDVQFSRDGTSAAIVRRVAVVQTAPVAGTIVGRVTERETEQPIPNAQVAVDGAGRAFTDSDGRYRIDQVPAGTRTVSVTSIGYARTSQEIEVSDGATATADFALDVSPTTLSELVVTATGQQRRVELGHVVGRINADSLVKETPVSSLSELLTARVPGLQVFQSQGTVGGQVHVQVRGPNSFLLNTEPIVIVDGVRYTTGTAQRPNVGFSGLGPGDTERTSPLNDLNLNDIESIEVVKGPSAATLYGTDAANGVIVVTTKRGVPGPARWNAYVKAGATTIPVHRFRDNYAGWGQFSDGRPTTGCHLQFVAQGFCAQDSVTMFANPLNDPDLSIFGRGQRWESGINVSGGLQDLRYFFSASVQDANSPVRMPPVIEQSLKTRSGLDELREEQLKPNTLTDVNLRANVTALFGESAQLQLHTGYIRNATRALGLSGRNPYNATAWTATPTDPYGTFDNRPEDAFSQTTTEETDRYFGSLAGQWQPTAWMLTRATIGLDLTSRDRLSLARRGDLAGSFTYRPGAVEDYRVKQLATTAELNATATGRAGRFSLRTSAGAQYVRNLSDGLWSFGLNLPPGGTTVGEAADVSTRQTYAETVTLGSYFEETIGLNDRLFLTGAIRVDGASAFGQDYDATVYPKASVSWLISEEPFLPRLAMLNELRLRYAFGASGQQPQPSWAQPGYGVNPDIQDGTQTTVIGLNALGNTDLRPERVREHEFGFDAVALQHRLELGATWFRRRTVDQIVSLTLPPGLGSIFTNLGLTTQRGFEADLTVHVLDAPMVSWDVMIQHGSHSTKLVDLGGAVPQYISQGGYAEGHPLGARFVPEILGFDDSNEDGIISASEVQLSEPRFAGESTPPRSQTFSTVMGLLDRRIRLSALFERRSGFTQVDVLRATQCRSGLCRAAVDPNMPLAEQAEVAALAGGHTFVEPGDFTRFRELTVSIDLPTRWLTPTKLGSATLTLSGRNLALWSDFDGPDPESAFVGLWNAAAGGTAEGIPQSRSWTLRLDFGF